MRTSRSFATLLVLFAAACGGSGSISNGTTNPTTGTTGGSNTGSTSNAILVADNSFSPNATTLATGTTVTWTWAGANQHNVTFDDGTKSGTQASGSYARTFSTAGTYPYHCTIHGAAMSGTITVK